jgi:hypothetical protein
MSRKVEEMKTRTVRHGLAIGHPGMMIAKRRRDSRLWQANMGAAQSRNKMP